MDGIHKNRSIGVTVLAILFIGISAIELTYPSFRFSHYRFAFRNLPEWLMIIRFCVTWGLRIAGIIAGIGMLFLKGFSRKIALGICWFNLIFIYWKHPSYVFDNIVTGIGGHDMPARIPVKLPFITFTMAIKPFLIAINIVDVLFALTVICFLNHPNVKGQFKKKMPNG